MRGSSAVTAGKDPRSAMSPLRLERNGSAALIRAVDGGSFTGDFVQCVPGQQRQGQRDFGGEEKVVCLEGAQPEVIRAI